MRSRLAVLVLVVGSSAFGHIKLTAPESFQVTDTFGSPNKAEPCGGPGTASNVITTVEAGSQLTVTWGEPILHPGHFRIGIAASDADFHTPAAVVTGGACISAPVETTPTYPTLADGLFASHTSTPAGGWSQTITVPMMSCDHCVLQLMQFMSAHGAPCFYYQCAALKIVLPDAGTPNTDAGTPNTDAGTPSTDAGTLEPIGDLTPAAGCGCTSGPLSLLLLLPLVLLRRRN